MDPKFRKFKQQESKSHEKLLKVILQIYKPVLRRHAKPNPETEETEEESSISEELIEVPSKPKDYSIYPTKVDNETLEKQRKEHQALKLIGENHCPALVSQYVNGEITLSQLKQSFYSQIKKIDYVCYDNLKSQLSSFSSAKHEKKGSRDCLKHSQKPSNAPVPRPKSASWNSNTKVPQPRCYSITNSIYTEDCQPAKPVPVDLANKKWNQSIKADPSLITDPYRLIRVTNDRRDRPVRCK